MATWKKVIVSGSSITQLTNTANFIAQSDESVILSGSFSGSFIGDGSGLTGVSAAGTLSSSAQIADDISGSLGTNAILIRSLTASGISGSFTSTSASIATDIATNVSDIADLKAFSSSLDSGFVTEAELASATSSLSSSLATDIATNTAAIASANSGSFSGSFQGAFTGDGSGLTGLDVAQTATVVESFSGQTSVSVTHNFGTKNVLATVYEGDTQIIPASITTTSDNVVTVTFDNATTGRVIVGKGGHIVSGSVPFANIINKPALLSGSAQIAADISGSFTSTSASIATDIAGLVTDSGSFSTRVETLEGSVGAGGLLSSSAQIATDISGSFTSVSGALATRVTSVEGNVSAILSASTADADTFAEIVTLINSVDLENDQAFAAHYTSSNGRITDLETDSGSFSTRVTTNESDIATLQGSVGAGGLLSSSAQIASDISGSFTSVSASIAEDIAGISTDFADITNKPTLVSGSSQVDYFGITSVPNGIVSGSVQVDITNTTGYTTFSSSIATDVATNVSDIADLVTDSGSFSTRVSSLEVFSSSLDAGFVSEAELVAATASLSSSLAVDIATNKSDVADLVTDSGSFSSRVTTNESYITDLFTDSGSFSTRITSNDSDIADLVTDSGSFSTRVTGVESDVTAILAASDADKDSFAEIVTLINSVDTANDEAFAAHYTASNNRLTKLEATGSDHESRITTNESDIATLQGSVGAGGLISSSIQVDITGTTGYTTFSSSLASDIATNVSNVADLVTDSGSFSTRVATNESDIADLVTDSGSFSTRITSNDSDIADLVTDSGSFSTRVSSVETDVTAILSASTADADTFAEIVSLINSVDLENDQAFAAYYTSSNGRITDLETDSGSFSTRVTTNESEIDALQVDSGSFATRVETLEGSVGAGGLLSSSAQIASDISGSFTSVSASIAADIVGNALNIADLVTDSGSFSTRVTTNESDIADLVTDSGSFSSRVTSNEIGISTLEGKTLVSASVLAAVQQGEVKLTTNGVDGSTVDLGLQTTDSPTFAGLTVNGNLVVTGDTIEAQVTNLNVEDKYILLNSGSATGDSGIVFGGANGAANTGVGLVWDSSYGTNDGRLAIVNTLAAGATGDVTPSYYVAGVFVGTDGDAQTAQADHIGNIRVEGGEVFIYTAE